jgi:light-regulated signal transduction histidine kinase (bacteriophytochrome)
VLSGLAIWAAFGGVGLFVNSTPNTGLLLLQTYVAVAAVMALGVAATVWERQQIDLRLQEHQRQLAQRNADLEQFAYAASHDLQEPLRTISIFTEIMVTEHKGQLGHQADGFIEFIVGGVARMNAMVQALLTYSGVLKSEQLSFSEVRLDEVIERAIKNLESAIREGHARIIAASLPVVLGEREHLVSLFQNLIGNGIKYRGDAPPEIRIAVAPDGGNWILSVSDNGIGIAPEYHDQIFGIFKRLHRAEIAGTGIGLAISRRIVEMHGGKLWLESEAGKGATFFFTIPRRGAAD